VFQGLFAEIVAKKRRLCCLERALQL